MPHRRSVSKRKSSKQFNKGAKKTHPLNMKIMRGGWRL